MLLFHESGKKNFGSINVVTIEIRNAEFKKKIGFLEHHKKSVSISEGSLKLTN
jgi:hypothetical protein